MQSVSEMNSNLPEIAKSPVLQAAINGLDVTLHDELERYRHWCEHGKREYSPPSFAPAPQIFTPEYKPAPQIAQNPEYNLEQSLENSRTNPEIDGGQAYHDIDLSSAIIRATDSPDTSAADPQANSSSSITQLDLGEAQHPSEFPEADLEEWEQAYQEQIRTPLGVSNDQTHQKTELDIAPDEHENHDKPDEAEPSDMEDDFLIGTAGVVSIALISFSSVAIALLLFDPFGFLRPKRTPPPPPAPQTQATPNVAPTTTIIDPDLLPRRTGINAPVPSPLPTPVSVTPPAASTVAPVQIVTVPQFIPRVVRPTTPKADPVAPPNPQTITPPTTIATPPPEVIYADPITGEITASPAPLPTATMTIPPAPPEGGNFAVVTDPSYKAYVQPLVQAVERPQDGKLQLGSYGDAATAAQKAEEWRRYGVPAQVIPR